MTWHQPSSLTSVAKVTGLVKVPSPPAVLCRQGWAMGGPGGEVSAQPYSVMTAFTAVGPGALAAVGAAKTPRATAAPRIKRVGLLPLLLFLFVRCNRWSVRVTGASVRPGSGVCP